MNEHTITECHLFPDIFDRPVVAKFDQWQGSSDGGAILLKAAERRLGLTSALAACLRDDRQPGKVEHALSELITQRVMAIALAGGLRADAGDTPPLGSDSLRPGASLDLARTFLEAVRSGRGLGAPHRAAPAAFLPADFDSVQRLAFSLGARSG